MELVATPATELIEKFDLDGKRNQRGGCVEIKADGIFACDALCRSDFLKAVIPHLIVTFQNHCPLPCVYSITIEDSKSRGGGQIRWAPGGDPQLNVQRQLQIMNAVVEVVFKSAYAQISNAKCGTMTFKINPIK